ncbi:hypothetical protein QN277_016500 [Acacia crassicarpa]|nr:hypothetical protein QN277_016500 [Acacia crassicarpa]
MLGRVQNQLNNPIFLKTVGSLSYVIGLVCHALSSSFESLIGEWNPTRIVLYIIFSCIISVVVAVFLLPSDSVVLFAHRTQDPVVSKLIPLVQFLVLMLTSLCSFFIDRYTKGKPDTWSVVSSYAFALTSMCIARQIRPDFDVGVSIFFLRCATVQLMKIHLIFILVAAGLCYPLLFLRSYLDSQLEQFLRSLQEWMDWLGRDLLPRWQEPQHRGQQLQQYHVGIASPSPSPPLSPLLTPTLERQLDQWWEQGIEQQPSHIASPSRAPSLSTFVTKELQSEVDQLLAEPQFEWMEQQLSHIASPSRAPSLYALVTKELQSEVDQLLAEPQFEWME